VNYDAGSREHVDPRVCMNADENVNVKHNVIGDGYFATMSASESTD